jgi:hypothetical protein
MSERYILAARVMTLMCVCVLIGAGCRETAAPVPAASVSDPRPASFAGLSPAEAARNIIPTAAMVLKMRQHITASGLDIARERGLGADVARDIVIRRFSPQNRVEVEWTASADTHRYTGAVVGGDLQRTYEMLPLPYWRENEQSAYGSSVLWLSRNIYENLTRSRFSTFHFGFFNPDARATLPASSRLAKAVNELEKAVARVSQDVTLTTAEPTSTQMLMVNGTSTQVEVFVARNWFGEMTVLNNPENPLVLRVKMNKLPVDALNGGLFDYEITEIKDVME